jgi:hypothetical protein
MLLQLDKAEEHYRRQVEINPSHPTAEKNAERIPILRELLN